jgi:hypothetical protein
MMLNTGNLNLENIEEGSADVVVSYEISLEALYAMPLLKDCFNQFDNNLKAEKSNKYKVHPD